MNVKAHAQTHVGRRENNEDAFVADESLGLFVVADGMGGHDGGEVASRLAVDALSSFYRRARDRGRRPCADRTDEAGRTVAESMMDMAFRLAHRDVTSKRVGALEDMGTTLAALLLCGDRAIVAHVGDSRVYRLRDRKLEAMTRDHSLYVEMEAAGVPGLPARADFPLTNVITRAIGNPGDAPAEVRTIDVEAGDVFLLCTDGLHDVLGDERIEGVLAELPGFMSCPSLVGEAFLDGGADNITGVVVEIGKPGTETW
jgi:serine/threonine protein phosphatase PrpC